MSFISKLRRRLFRGSDISGNDISNTDYQHIPNEDEDCFSNYTTPTNYLKSIFFISIYWITLAVVLVAGATKISLFSLGYLIGCFIFLWLGNDTYLMPIRRLKFYWTIFIIYAAIVIVLKALLQTYACFLHDYLVNYCYILQLLRVVCYQDPANPLDPTNPAAICSASLPNDEFDILWDVLCLMFLIMQRVVFGSQYFRYLVKEVKAQQILASRGAELIMATQIEEAKAQALYEKEVMLSIREKMENLKSDNEKTSEVWARLLSLPHHHQIIRNADKHLFSSTLDEPVSQCGSDNWKFKKAFIPDPLGDELERMNDINGISAVFTRWMKGKPLYGPPSGSDYATSELNTPPQQSHSHPGSNPTSSPQAGIIDPSQHQQETRDNSPVELVQPEITEPQQDSDTQPPVDINFSVTGPEQQQQPPEQQDEAIEMGDGETQQPDEMPRIRGWREMLNLFVYSCLLSLTVKLNKLSRSYRYVSRRMAVEKNALKKQFNLNDERFKTDPKWRKWVISTLSETYTKTNKQYQENQSNTSLHRIRSALRVITSSASGPGNSPPESSAHSSDGRGEKSPIPIPGVSNGTKKQRSTELTDPEYHFLKLNIFTQFCRALAYVFISNTSLWCQLVIIFYQILNASLLSLPLPLLTFLWGTLSVPRPTKRFWKTVITYTELVIVVKYVCQFPIWSWEASNINPFYYPNLLGIKNITITYDLVLLLALFFHRSMLKSLGQWGSSGNQYHDEGHAALLERDQNSPSHYGSGGDISPVGNNNSDESNQIQIATTTIVEEHPSMRERRLVQSCDLKETIDNSVELEPKLFSNSYADIQEFRSMHDYEVDSYQNQQLPHITQQVIQDENDPIEPTGRCTCCARAYNRVRRSISMFFQHVLNTPYKVQTDVYTWMFLCDFINFLILIYGFWAFGSGYTNQTVASFLNENRIPFSVLIMLLAQFASIIIDRAFYLQKNLGGKLMFQVVLVIGIHLWLFFLLPFSTGHTLTLKEYWPPKAWYVIKCIYFLLSAHQIRCGYPRRVLGNCFTEGFGYANWGAFKVYRAIPLVYDLRLYMDWIWTETTLEFRNWSIMEDMFANLFIRKCELTLEEEYPTPRAKPIRHLSKYLTGGAFILLILAIIWGPLLLFSMGKTVGDSNPPAEMEYELEFVGFQPILRLKATAQQITTLNSEQYDQLTSRFVSLNSQSFLGDYKLGDVVAIKLDGQSNAVWEISPPSKTLLMNNIKNNETITLKSSWTIFRIKREKSQGFDVNIAGSYQEVINGTSSQEFRQSLYDMLANSSTTQTEASQTKFVITPPIFPNYIRAPETGQVSLVDQFKDNNFEYNSLRPLNLSYIRMFDLNINKTDNSTSWWKSEDLCKYKPQNDSYPFWSTETLSHCDALLVVAFNDRIFTGILALLSAPGIIGLYTTFVVFFARLIRTEPAGKVIYTEIPSVDRVYGLIMDIYMVRECGEFELEEKLFAKLLFLYRSPEMLIEWSKRQDELRMDQQQQQRDLLPLVDGGNGSNAAASSSYQTSGSGLRRRGQ